MMNRLLFGAVLLLGSPAIAQEPDTGNSSSANTVPQLPIETNDQTLSDDRESLVIKMRDAYWDSTDKKEVKRKAEPMLSVVHEKMTRQWVAKLKDEDVQVLSSSELDSEEAKRKKELDKEYLKKSKDVAVQVLMARRISSKLIKSHWDGLAQTGVNRNAFPEYTRDFETTVENWFMDRTLEDLKIFEKARPNESERERGDKITAELIKKIEEVKQKYEGNMR